MRILVSLTISVGFAFVCLSSGCSNHEPQFQIIEDHKVGLVHLSIVETQSALGDPCGFMERFEN
jgi:hypothetical protein